MKESDASDDLPFLFVGRLTSEKGLRHAIEACRGVGRRLRVVGDGAGRSDLQREFPDVTFEGWLTHAEVLRAMRQACAVLVPSLWAETSALVAHEAVSVGSPVVVSSRICAASELVASGCAIAVDPADQSAFQAALRQMMDPLQRRMFRRAAEERARQTSAPMLQEAYLSRLEELVGRQTSDAATGTRGT
jgi:glycosyltransferase involved in cell wall biosynthesis